MSFFGEVSKALGLDYIKEVDGYNLINYSGKSIYIEGIKRFVKIGDTEIVVAAKTAFITIIGNNLSIVDLEVNCAIIKGIIITVTTEEKNER